MNPHAIEAIGYVGAAILNTSAVPQIYKCYRTRSARDFSWAFFGSLLVGMTLNFTYGFLLHHPAIYTGSGISLMLYGTIAGMKYVYESADGKSPGQCIQETELNTLKPCVSEEETISLIALDQKST